VSLPFIITNLFLISAFLFIGGVYFFSQQQPSPLPEVTASKELPSPRGTEPSTLSEDLVTIRPVPISSPQIIAPDLEIPWELTWLPSGEILVTERPGRMVIINSGRAVIPVSDVVARGEGGLLGLALHPNFSDNRWLYLYLTTAPRGDLINQVRRYRLDDSQLSDMAVIIDNIPAGSNHNGGRMSFGPDRLLYVTTGDAGQAEASQDPTSLAGKILRVDDHGRAPADNPFDNAVYSLGHRNSQGLAWDSTGRLWAIDHGRSGIVSGLDELNLIVPGGNYGWPRIQGDETAPGLIPPVIHSGPDTTWAPGGLAIFNNTIVFSGLRGQRLYAGTINNNTVINMREILPQSYGRLRAVKRGPDGNLYITTSNRDGRGRETAHDDKIIQVPPEFFNN
jgi:glucose/arabinose dehydrogenase